VVCRPLPESGFQRLYHHDRSEAPHIIGTDGKEMWATGGWSTTIKGDYGFYCGSQGQLLTSHLRREADLHYESNKFIIIT
jgi:hypothetical protein